MSRSCSLCNHPKRRVIDEAIVAGKEPQTKIAERFGTSTSALYRHGPHVTGKVVEAVEALDRTARQAEGMSLAERLRWLIGEAERLKAAAEAAGDLRTALQGLREMMRVLEFVADVERLKPTVDAREEFQRLPREQRWDRLLEAKQYVAELEAEFAAEEGMH
jgi:ribosome-binding protein aMBF1 (putative translation factor)